MIIQQKVFLHQLLKLRKNTTKINTRCKYEVHPCAFYYYSFRIINRQNELKTQPNTIDQNDDVVDTLTSRKRSTNYANLSPSIIKRKYPSEIVRVLVEGKLNIQEINSNSSRPRTIRSVSLYIQYRHNVG
jgi:hypothetical protein